MVQFERGSKLDFQEHEASDITREKPQPPLLITSHTLTLATHRCQHDHARRSFPGCVDTGGGTATLRHGSAWEREEEMLVRGGDNQVAAVNYFRYTDVFYIGPVWSDSSSAGRHVEWLRSMISFFAWFLVYAVETFVLCHCSLLVA